MRTDTSAQGRCTHMKANTTQTNKHVPHNTLTEGHRHESNRAVKKKKGMWTIEASSLAQTTSMRNSPQKLSSVALAASY